MNEALRLAYRQLRRGPTLAFAAWSVPEAVPAALSGVAVAHAVDDGFLAHRPMVGLAWLAGYLLAAGVGAIGTRQSYRRLADLVEPLRDDVVRRVVRGSLDNAVAGRVDDGAVSRLTHQVEIVRDSFAGLVLVLRNFAITAGGAVIGMLSIAPVIAALVLPPFLVGLAAFVATLGLAASRQRTYIRADEQLATSAGAVLHGIRDVVATGAERHAAAMVAAPIAEQAAAERAIARVGAARTLCFAVGGWLPLLILVGAGPWLVGRGLTAGAIMGGLTYVLRGLQPALGALAQGLGGSGLRFTVTLGRILDACRPATAGAVPTGAVPTGAVPTGAVPSGAAPAGAGPSGAVPVGAAGYRLALRDVTFGYGSGEPVLRGLELTIPEDDHLAVVGPSGVGKSTLASVLCGLRQPDAGQVRFGAVPVGDLSVGQLARSRVLIPQEAYVFTGTLRDNLGYLAPRAGTTALDQAVLALGAEALVARLGGYDATIRPVDLSAGERQLLALVRAYLSPAPVAVLDEATCHLDPVAEQRAEEAFAARGGTLVVIAHRVSSAVRARRTLVLDGVRPTIGTHDELLEHSALYRDLVGHWTAADEPSASASRSMTLSRSAF